MKYPVIIQGGMGAAVSDWRLARAVARQGQLGVVSGTALDLIVARRLQLGDPCGSMRRALEAFPHMAIGQRIRDDYFIDGGKGEDEPFRLLPMYSVRPSLTLLQLCVVANFAEVHLAKEGHNGLVGLNLLAKIELPNLASLYGAMLAGVDYVIVGAGIPREIPGILDRLANHQDVSMRISVENACRGEEYRIDFSPKEVTGLTLPQLKRPKFIAIVASHTLAKALTRKANGQIDGFIVEGATAGGHNAPPRGRMVLTDAGEPIYGARDQVDLGAMLDLGLPFWLAGSYGSAGKLDEARREGAVGIQVGTAFALCDESGLQERLKEQLRQQAVAGTTRVFTDPLASPTGFPFKVADLPNTLGDAAEYARRPRICDLGYLRTVFKKDDGALGYRCPAEPVEAYAGKGGSAEATNGRKCLCNSLTSNVGLAQSQKTSGYREKPLVTVGNDFQSVAHLAASGNGSYTARDVIDLLLS